MFNKKFLSSFIQRKQKVYNAIIIFNSCKKEVINDRQGFQVQMGQ